MKALVRAVRGTFGSSRAPESTGDEPRPSGLDRHAGVLLAVIVLAAFAVRVWAIGHGLPHIYTTDEGFEVKRALKLGAGQFDFGRTFKGGLYFILFLEYGLYYVVLRVTGSIHSSYEFLVSYFRDPTPFWLMGRMTNAVIGTLTAIPLFILGRRMGGVRTGLLAALFLAFCARHVQLSRLIGVDVLMVALLALCFLYLQSADRTKSTRALALASLFAALATATKFPAIVATLSIAIVAIGRFREAAHPMRSIVRTLALCAAVFAGASVLVNPQIVPAMLGGAKTLLQGSTPSFNASHSEVFAARTPKIWLFYWESITWSLGLPLTIAGILGALQALRRRTLYDIGLVTFVVVFYVAICSPATDDFVYPRYSQPIQLVLFLFAAQLVSGIVDRIPLGRGRSIALATITAALMIVPTVRTIRHDLKQSRTDTRTLALEWIEAHVPEGARIVIEGKDYGPGVGTAPLANRPENIKAILQRLQERDSRWRSGIGQASGSEGVSTGNGTTEDGAPGPGPRLGNGDRDAQYAADKDRFHRAAMEARAGLKTYDLALFGTETFPYRHLSEYLDEGAEYLVVNARDVEEFVQPRNAARFPVVAAFYAELQSSRRLNLRVRFDGEKEGRPGPDLLIYQVVSESRPASRDAAGPSGQGIATDVPTTFHALAP